MVRKCTLIEQPRTLKCCLGTISHQKVWLFYWKKSLMERSDYAENIGFSYERGSERQVHWFNSIKALCHGKLERYQRLTFITPYFVAWTNSRCLRTMRTTYVFSTSFVGKRSLMLTHRVRLFSHDVMSMPIVWWATMYISFSRKDLLKSHRYSFRTP